MRTRFPLVFAYALLILFFIQLTGTLVESIYILDLLNTSLDENALGLLFFFSPVLLLPLGRSTLLRLPLGWLVGLDYLVLLTTRGIIPYLDTSGRLLASGAGTGVVLLLLPALFAANPKGEPRPRVGIAPALGLALAVGLSIMLRSLNHSLDYSLTRSGDWVGWALGLLLGFSMLRLEWRYPLIDERPKFAPTLALVGLLLVLTLVYAAFSAPAVIARWTSGSYPIIVLATSLLTLGWAGAVLFVPRLLVVITRPLLFAWNLLFTLALTATLLAHRVPFPPSPISPPVTISQPGFLQQIPLVLMLLLFPIVFVDMGLFARQIQVAAAAPRAYIPGLLLGALALVAVVFMQIFTNVWGYVPPVSSPFRNQFYLPYTLLGVGLTLLVTRPGLAQKETVLSPGRQQKWIWGGLLVGVLFLTVSGVLRSDRISPHSPGRENSLESLRVMTYNIQQANDKFGEKSYLRQLELIQMVNPDVLALQENDSTRLGLNNNDYVRYYASELGYYSYYGPATVAGTFGTAILSRYPLQNPHTIYSYSDQDEIATTAAEITFGGRVFTIFNVHPDGSDLAMEIFAKTLLARAADQSNVIALGDFNLRDYEAAYQMIDAVFTNAWTSVYPSEISPDWVDMSGENRIDHIFISPHLTARDPVYLLPPASATDHPVHWADITWEQ